MKREAIIVIIILIFIAAIVVAFVFSATNPGPSGFACPGPYSGNMMGPGMMRSGMMGSGMMGSGMGMITIYSADSQPVPETDARSRAQAYANQYYPGAKTGDFMEFSLNYYVELKDTSNASVAEILVDRYTGAVTPEPGPNMMWNTGNRAQRSAASVVYDMAGGKSKAEKFLAGYLPDATIQESTSYPGYYTFDFGRGKIEGMLSVNTYTGDIWVHTWHGQFIGE